MGSNVNCDSQELAEGIQTENRILRYKQMFKKYRVAFITFGVIVLFQIIIILVLFNQTNFYKQNYKMNYLSIYNVEQTIIQKNRRKEAMSKVMKVGLYFNPNINERVLAQIAATMYDVGEKQYNIAVEEQIVWITGETEWYYRGKKSISHKGAKGLTQLMPVTAMYLAGKLNITYRGNTTLFNPIENLRMGMRYYFDLKTEYKSPEYYITAYCWGEGSIGKFARNKRPITGRHRDYLNRFLTMKKKVEKVLGEKIIIYGLDDRR